MSTKSKNQNVAEACLSIISQALDPATKNHDAIVNYKPILRRNPIVKEVMAEIPEETRRKINSMEREDVYFLLYDIYREFLTSEEHQAEDEAEDSAELTS